MSGVLYLDRRMVNGDVERLRRAIASHTESEQTATELLKEILVARGGGQIEHVTLLPSSLAPDAVGRGWKLRVRMDPLAL